MNFIKDSANNYTLYIDKNSTASLVLDLAEFDVPDLATAVFFGAIKRHFSESQGINLTFSPNEFLNNLTIQIPTIDLVHPKYKFDVYYRLYGNTAKLISGDVFVSGGIATIPPVEEAP